MYVCGGSGFWFAGNFFAANDQNHSSEKKNRAGKKRGKRIAIYAPVLGYNIILDALHM
jgi:hypothetical protein